MSKLHNNPQYFIQVIENALHKVFSEDKRWNIIYDFYEARYLNPDSPYHEAIKHSIVEINRINNDRQRS
jgi:hypothetical protein